VKLQYDTIDPEIIWKTIHEDLPKLRTQLTQIVMTLTNYPAS